MTNLGKVVGIAAVTNWFAASLLVLTGTGQSGGGQFAAVGVMGVLAGLALVAGWAIEHGRLLVLGAATGALVVSTALLIVSVGGLMLPAALVTLVAAAAAVVGTLRPGPPLGA